MLHGSLEPNLLFQSIVAGWIALHEDLKLLQGAATTDLKKVRFVLVKLAEGNREEHLWQENRGLLSALDDKCKQLRESNNKYAAKLSACTIKTIDAFQHALKSLPPINGLIPPTCARSIKRGLDSMESFAAYLSKAFATFKEDENTLFFFLRYAMQLDGYYGKGFTFDLFNQFHVGGLNEVVNLIRKKYKERGFEQLFPTIAAKVEELISISKDVAPV